MSNVTTWAVLTDGKYVRIVVNKGTDSKLLTLKAEENEAYAELCYQVVNGKPKSKVSESVKSEQLDSLQLIADFLAEQFKEHMFDRIVIAAQEEFIDKLKAVLSEELKAVVVAQHDEDLLAKSNDDIQKTLADIISGN